jgi:hypothetical protein
MLPDDLLHVGKNGRDAFLGGFDDHLPIRIAPDILAKEIEALP